MDISERRLPQDGAIRVSMEDSSTADSAPSTRNIDIRVSTLAGKFGEKVVCRIVDAKNSLLSLDKLGMDDELKAQFCEIIQKPHGIILVTGPTGSGKSTTLYSVLKSIASPSINVCTAEDPVEINLLGINQFQIREKIGLTFSTILRSLLRQDPDVIMVGEIRDADTAKIAVQAALTGHLVFSTLHTNDSVSAVTRLTNLGVENYLSAASIRAVLAQRLVRRICNNCKTQTKASESIKKMGKLLSIEVDNVYQGVGCSRCNQTGYRGRVGLYELFIPDEKIRDAMAQGVSLNKLRKLAEKMEMKRIIDDGIQKALAGETSFEEVLKVAAV